MPQSRLLPGVSALSIIWRWYPLGSLTISHSFSVEKERWGGRGCISATGGRIISVAHSNIYGIIGGTASTHRKHLGNAYWDPLRWSSAYSCAAPGSEDTTVMRSNFFIQARINFLQQISAQALLQADHYMILQLNSSNRTESRPLLQKRLGR